MWQQRFFKTEASARRFMARISGRHVAELIFVQNGCVVEYKRLKPYRCGGF